MTTQSTRKQFYAEILLGSVIALVGAVTIASTSGMAAGVGGVVAGLGAMLILYTVHSRGAFTQKSGKASRS